MLRLPSSEWITYSQMTKTRKGDFHVTFLASHGTTIFYIFPECELKSIRPKRITAKFWFCINKRKSNNCSIPTKDLGNSLYLCRVEYIKNKMRTWQFMLCQQSLKNVTMQTIKLNYIQCTQFSELYKIKLFTLWG